MPCPGSPSVSKALSSMPGNDGISPPRPCSSSTLTCRSANSPASRSLATRDVEVMYLFVGVTEPFANPQNRLLEPGFDTGLGERRRVAVPVGQNDQPAAARAGDASGSPAAGRAGSKPRSPAVPARGGCRPPGCSTPRCKSADSQRENVASEPVADTEIQRIARRQHHDLAVIFPAIRATSSVSLGRTRVAGNAFSAASLPCSHSSWRSAPMTTCEARSASSASPLRRPRVLHAEPDHVNPARHALNTTRR